MPKKRAEARARYYCREEAKRLGWKTAHPSKKGNFLEEQEIVDFFPSLKEYLGQDRPDFVIVQDEKPVIVIETKNEFEKIDKAIAEGEGYAENISKLYPVKLVIGVAGSPDAAVQTRTRYRVGSEWKELTANGYPLTQIPTPDEVAISFANDDGTTDVRLPSDAEFYEAAIAISHKLRKAKIEDADRPRVVATVILALYQADFSLDAEVVIGQINANVRAAIQAWTDIPNERRESLISTLALAQESRELASVVRHIVLQLERLNVRSIMRSSVDFLGQFYEAFLRYGARNKNLGIVFTPRHITRYCAELVDVDTGMKVYDPACGTGGFLVSAFDCMVRSAGISKKAIRQIHDSLYGFDTSATVWALAMLNMRFRGDGKSNIVNDNCFHHIDEVKQIFHRALLNPPFAQEDEPERNFIDHALEALMPGGELAAVVPAGVLADDHHKEWRKRLLAHHSVLATISMPIDLFYPMGSPTALLVVKAHTPSAAPTTFMAKIHNDGYEILKNRRVTREGSQLDEVLQLYRKYRQRVFSDAVPGIACCIQRGELVNGAELCAEKWLPQSQLTENAFQKHFSEALRMIYLASIPYPGVIAELIDDFDEQLTSIKPSKGKKLGERARLSSAFKIVMGKSSGLKNYNEGETPYISSAEPFNSIVGQIAALPEERFDSPRITVTAFGRAYIQPWCFCARGNGGSAVRVLKPLFPMSTTELLWYTAQINFQNWRFHYGRMAIKSRLEELEVDPYPGWGSAIANMSDRVREFNTSLEKMLP